MALDGAGNIYVADENNHRIRKLTPTGVVTTFAGSSLGFSDGIGTAAQFSGPAGIAVDASGNIYVADVYNHRIRKITGGVAGLNDINFDASFFIYPNPSNGQITLKLEDNIENCKLKIHNVLGEEVYNKTINESSTLLNLNLNAGLYIITLYSNGSEVTKKMIIE